MNWFYNLILVAIALAIGLPTARGQETKTSGMPPHLREILSWLPTDSETLIVANGPFELRYERDDVRLSLGSARLLAFGLAAGLQDGLIAKQLCGKNVLIAVETSRRFTSPRGLGMMPFEGCQILKFDEAAHDAVHAAVDSCIERASSTIQLGDTKVAVLKEKWEDDEWSLFVAEPLHGVLLCATNQGFLKQMLARMGRENQDRAFPDSLPEWGHVNVNATVWGMRHYRNDFANADPSSPLGPEAAANVPDSDAVGFTFGLDSRKAQACYLSGAKHATAIATRGWCHPAENFTPSIMEIKPGVVEIVAPVIEKDDDGEDMFLFILLGYLGHAVYL